MFCRSAFRGRRPNLLCAINFQFDSTIGGKAMKIASMIDERPRMSLFNLIDRSITRRAARRRAQKVFAAADGPPRVLRMGQRAGVHF